MGILQCRRENNVVNMELKLFSFIIKHFFRYVRGNGGKIPRIYNFTLDRNKSFSLTHDFIPGKAFLVSIGWDVLLVPKFSVETNEKFYCA